MFSLLRMFRVRIAIALAVLLSLILILAGALYWGMQQTQYHFHRSQLAQAALEAYSRLPLDAYLHFNEIIDAILIDRSIGGGQDSQEMRARLEESMENVAAAVRREIAYLESFGMLEERQGEIQELADITAIRAIIRATLASLAQVGWLRSQGHEAEAHALLNMTLQEIIDREFRPMVEGAIERERAEAEREEQRANETARQLQAIATVVAVLSALFAAVAGFALFRSIDEPIRVLVWGTRRVAKGDLSHRIQLGGRNEFTYLARNFNFMAASLEQEHTRLLEIQAGQEKKIAQRTASLSEANNQLRRIDQTRRQFLADISHELRTPLTVIRGEAEVTLRGSRQDQEEYRTALRRIVDLSEQLAKLVDDIFFLTRADLAELRFDTTLVTLNELMAEAKESARVLAQKKRLTVTLDAPEERLIIDGDPLRLGQLLLILVDNACRYSHPSGMIALTLARAGEFARITVADQGIGIPEEEQGAIFERFYRGTQARWDAPEGTGLGLPLAKAIVKTHGGNITLKSASSAGTIITIELPLHKDERDGNGDSAG